MSKPYHRIGLGGTFDHFHIGHRTFLQFATELAEELVVGVTRPELTTHKAAAELIEPYEVRAQNVQQFLQGMAPVIDIFPLTDPFGPTLSDPTIDALAVTEETVAGAEAINSQRERLGLKPLPVHVCALVRDTHGKLVSSTRVRLGEVNRDGDVYLDIFHDDRVFTPAQSEFFKTAQGPLVSDFSSKTARGLVIIVGDIVTETFLSKGWPFSLAIYDHRTRREIYNSPTMTSRMHESAAHITNPSGTITSALASWLSQYFQARSQNDSPTQAELLHTQYLYINGEEDLATVAAVILAPLGTTIVYGQPDEGMVQLLVTEALKTRFIQGMSA